MGLFDFFKKKPEIPKWREYYTDEVVEKFKNDVYEILEKNKEEIITLKKENDYDDLHHNAEFLQNMSIYDLIYEVADSGLNEISENRGIPFDNLVTHWTDEGYHKDLEDDAYTVIKTFWDQLKVTKEEVNKEPSETEQEPAKSFFFPNTNKFNSLTKINYKLNIFPPKLTLDKNYKNIKDDLKGIDTAKINWLSNIKDLRKIDFDKKGLEFYFLSWYTEFSADLQLEKSDNNTSDEIITEWDDYYSGDNEDDFDETNEIYGRASIMSDVCLDFINDKTYIKKMNEKFLEFENENYKNEDDWSEFFEWLGVSMEEKSVGGFKYWMPMEELGDFKNSKDIIKQLLGGVTIIDTGYKVSWYEAKEGSGYTTMVWGYSYNSSKANKS